VSRFLFLRLLRSCPSYRPSFPLLTFGPPVRVLPWHHQPPASFLCHGFSPCAGTWYAPDVLSLFGVLGHSASYFWIPRPPTSSRNQRGETCLSMTRAVFFFAGMSFPFLLPNLGGPDESPLSPQLLGFLSFWPLALIIENVEWDSVPCVLRRTSPLILYGLSASADFRGITRVFQGRIQSSSQALSARRHKIPIVRHAYHGARHSLKLPLRLFKFGLTKCTFPPSCFPLVIPASLPDLFRLCSCR